MYFKNLDGLRFIAALFVIIGHCQAILFNHYGIRTYSPWAEKLANFGVDFFFVLSGFLISFLLLKELEKTQTIHIKNFYIRRILRLWPLYFLVGLVAIFTSEPLLHWLGMVQRGQENVELLGNLGYLTFFGINFQILNGHMNDFSSATVGHFWSLGVEEQFYLFFAPVLLFFRKKTWLFIIAMITIGVIFTLNDFSFYKNWFPNNAYLVPTFFTICKFYHFGLGAGIGWLILNQNVWLPTVERFFSNRFVQYFLQLAFWIPMCMYLFGHHFYFEKQERIINGVISVGIILTAILPHSILFFEWKILKYLGKISFGIYIFHLFAVHFTMKILFDFGFLPQDMSFQILYPILASIVAISLAILAFEKIEKPILSLKERFK